MPLEVQGQVVGPGECPLTHTALERPVPGVLPRVAGQLIGPGKLPPAALELAEIGLLPSVSTLMGLEVAGLGVCLGAALIGTVVDHWLTLGVVALLPWLDHLLGRVHSLKVLVKVVALGKFLLIL